MDYEEAKNVVKRFFNGVEQPVLTVLEALETINESDYDKIQEESSK